MIYKRGGVYWFKFVQDGRSIRRSTRQSNDKKARLIEARVKSELALGNWGILEKKTAPTLRQFLQQDFLPYVEMKHAGKPRTMEYYQDGAKLLCNSDLSSVGIDEINDQHAQRFGAQYARLSPSGINRGLRTLRRALNLAFEWRSIERPARIHLVPGEHQRDRVLTQDEGERYLRACPQPWRDCASIIMDEGMRPSEVFGLRWQYVLLNGNGGLIRIIDGKSKAARRTLPMTPRVHRILRDCHAERGYPTEGWIFPSNSHEGHFNGDTAKDQHSKALADSGVHRFEPYVLRHTGLTRIAAACNDPFVVMRIAGHFSITMTQRYCHPQADAVERAFTSLEKRREILRVGTKLGTKDIIPNRVGQEGFSITALIP